MLLWKSVKLLFCSGLPHIAMQQLAGNREKDIKYIHSGIVGIDVWDVDRIRIVAKINPEIRSEAPVTSIEVCLLTNLVIAITPPAKANAESIASKSPKVMTNGNIGLKSNERLETVAKNPNNAIITPTSCIFRSFSFSSNHASINTTIVSKGPAKRPSFETPTLVTESYHKNTAEQGISSPQATTSMS